jgi:hypothetical protein
MANKLPPDRTGRRSPPPALADYKLPSDGMKFASSRFLFEGFDVLLFYGFTVKPR